MRVSELIKMKRETGKCSKTDEKEKIGKQEDHEKNCIVRSCSTPSSAPKLGEVFTRRKYGHTGYDLGELYAIVRGTCQPSPSSETGN